MRPFYSVLELKAIVLLWSAVSPARECANGSAAVQVR